MDHGKRASLPAKKIRFDFVKFFVLLSVEW